MRDFHGGVAAMDRPNLSTFRGSLTLAARRSETCIWAQSIGLPLGEAEALSSQVDRSIGLWVLGPKWPKVAKSYTFNEASLRVPASA